MAGVGYFSPRGVFIVTVCLLIPAVLALRSIAAGEIDPERAHGAASRRVRKPPTKPGELMHNRPLLIFAGCLLLFHSANAAMLPLVGSVVTMRSARWATILIGACIVVPQLVVAALSPWIGQRAQIWGRRPLLLIGFAALPVRGLLFAWVTDPEVLVVIQILDGITAAVFSVMVPLVVADLTRGTGHFNLGQGIVGTFVGIGASLSATLAGYITDHFGSPAAFMGLAGNRGDRLCGGLAVDARDADRRGGSRLTPSRAGIGAPASQLPGRPPAELGSNRSAKATKPARRRKPDADAARCGRSCCDKPKDSPGPSGAR